MSSRKCVFVAVTFGGYVMTVESKGFIVFEVSGLSAYHDKAVTCDTTMNDADLIVMPGGEGKGFRFTGHAILLWLNI